MCSFKSPWHQSPLLFITACYVILMPQEPHRRNHSVMHAALLSLISLICTKHELMRRSWQVCDECGNGVWSIKKNSHRSPRGSLGLDQPALWCEQTGVDSRVTHTNMITSAVSAPSASNTYSTLTYISMCPPTYLGRFIRCHVRSCEQSRDFLDACGGHAPPSINTWIHCIWT